MTAQRIRLQPAGLTKASVGGGLLIVSIAGLLFVFSPAGALPLLMAGTFSGALFVYVLMRPRRVPGRRVARAAADQSAQQIVRTFENLGLGWFKCKRDEGTVWLSERARELLGLDASEPDERSITELFGLIDMQDRPRLVEAFSGAVPDAPFGIEFRLADTGSGTRWRMIRASLQTGTPAEITGLVYGIDLRKGAETALHASESRARRKRREIEALYRNAPIGMATLDRDLRFTRINEKLAEINGVPAAEHIGRTAWEIVPALRESVEPLLLGVLESGKPVRDVQIVGETRLKPGVIREWREQFYPVTTETGEIIGVGVVCEEITDEKRMERLADERQHRIQRLLAANVVGIVVINDEAVLDANDMFLALIGQERASLARREINWRRLTPPEFERADSIALDEMNESGTCRPYMKRYVHREGHQVPVMIGGMRFDEADGPVYVCYVVDLTDRERAEEAVRSASAMLQLVIDNLASFVAILTLEGHVIEVNSAPLAQLGIIRTDMLGRELWSAPPWIGSQTDRDMLRNAFEAAKRGEPARHDIASRTADGGMLMLEFTFGAVRAASGHVSHIIASAIDVSERRRREDHVRALLRELSHRSNNLLAVVAATARMTGREAPDPREFERRFLSRLQILAAVHTLLVESAWEPIGVGRIVEAALSFLPNEARLRVRSTGGPMKLEAFGAQHLALAINELVDISRHGGALASAAGTVDVDWQPATGDGLAGFALTWTDNAAPSQASRDRLGQSLLSRIVPDALGADVDPTVGDERFAWKISSGAGPEHA